MRKLIRYGKPRRLQGLLVLIFGPLLTVWIVVWAMLRRQMTKIAFPSRLAVLSPAA